MLVPEGYRLGQDIGEYSNDSEISGKRATAQLKGSGHGIAGKQRREGSCPSPPTRPAPSRAARPTSPIW
ncbi:hypothetical protein [Streptomyces atratus]|uniref:hypothetical protein n=1 Tax=Streptomyces atratus TaxID=1893 RepID=UPI0033C7312B